MRRLIAARRRDRVVRRRRAAGLLAPRRRAAGAGRVVASTHGHEVGWSMLPRPGGVAADRDGVDVVTYMGELHPGRSPPRSGRRGPGAAAAGGGHRPVRAGPAARAELRARYRLGERPVVVCVSRLVPRKGQDVLIRAMPAIRQRVPGPSC